MALSTPSGLSVAVAGDIWWGGFTAEITITNTTGSALSGWSYSFESPHQLNSAPWGATLQAEPLDNGLFRYTLSGADWGAAIPAGGSVTVGFNGQQGVDLGVTGSLNQELLMAGDSASPEVAPQPESQPVVDEPVPAPVVDVPDPVIEEPVMDHGSEDHSEMDHSGHDHGMAASPQSGDYIDITSWGTFHGSNNNSEHTELVGGRTAITTEAMVAYNGLRAFAGLDAVEIQAVGEWAFSQGLTNNSQAWGNDTKGVGLWYAMQGAKVGWIADEAYDPQILADIQRTARLGSENDVMGMVREFGHEGFADYIQQSGLQEAFINTLKMEPHYGGWMHGRTHGFLDVEGVAIAHDINHLTVLGWDQNQPFMNDTFDWPQWPALEVSDQTVINYYQGIVALGDPLGQNLEDLGGGGVVTPAPVVEPEPEPVAAEPEPIEVIEAVESAPVVDVPDPVIEEPVMDHGSEDHSEMDHSGHDHGMAASPQSGDYIDITSWGTFHGSNNNSEHTELVGGRTAITTEAMVAYNGLRAFAGLDAVEIQAVGEWAFSQGLTNNSQAWGNDTKGVGLWYAMQGAKVGWIADEAYDPQILADIQRTARLGSENDVMGMVREFGHEGFADYIQQSGLQEAFINTLKMEPHYGGWMHGRTHGFLDVEGVAIAHDINHLTVLGWDQNQPFMNDTFDWPQWPALEVSDQTVINYYQGIVALGDPLGQNLEDLAGGGVVTPEPQPVPFPGPLLPEEGPAEIDPVVGAPVDVEVSGDLWWGGFTASLTVTNQSDQTLDDWALSFTSAHRFYGEAWGVEVVTEQLSGDLYRYELNGADWGQSIGAGESRTVGFNALAGTDLARNGSLSEDTLLATGTDFTVL